MRVRHEMPFSAELSDDGVRFAIWAPAARYAHLHVDGRTLPLESRANGFFHRVVAEAGACA